MASRNGRFFDGGYSGHKAKVRDYISESIRNTNKQLPLGVKWQSDSYETIAMPKAPLVCYDPPYKGTYGNSTSKSFEHDRVCDWARQMKRDGHTVYISEYQMPGAFSHIWEKQITNSVNLTKIYQATERIWTL